MKIKRRVEIITVQEQTYQHHFSSSSSAPGWCADCQNHTPMVSPELAATISRITVRTLFRWIESGHIHFVETPGGSVLLCLQSITAHARQVVESEVVFSNGSCSNSTANQRNRSPRTHG